MEETKIESKNYTAVYILILITLGIMFFNQYLMFNIGSTITTGITGAAITSTSSSTLSSSAVIPKGIPAIYGQELGVSYDDVSPNDPAKADATIEKLAAYENMNLTGNVLQRYIEIASNISCEYCCGAPSIIFSNGNRACGCAHSYAMRGLAKYLLTKHPEMTNDQILEELGKWKTLFFPEIMAQKAEVLKQKGIEFNYINLASNKYRGIEQGSTSSGGMVGGC